MPGSRAHKCLEQICIILFFTATVEDILFLPCLVHCHFHCFFFFDVIVEAADQAVCPCLSPQTLQTRGYAPVFINLMFYILLAGAGAGAMRKVNGSSGDQWDSDSRNVSITYCFFVTVFLFT